MNDREKLDLMRLLHDMDFADHFIVGVLLRIERGNALGEAIRQEADSEPIEEVKHGTV
jgi:hypothetical protein